MTSYSPILRRTLKRPHGTILLLLAAVLLASCASAPFGRTNEPKIIAIRNQSGADIDTVTLREASRSASRAVRFGSLSPVPNGVTQVMVRQSNPPALPKTIVVEWVDSENRTRMKEVSLAAALRSASGSRDEALVLEFGPRDEVLVYVETMSQ